MLRLPADRAGRSHAAWATLVLAVLFGAAADLASKSWTFENVASRPVVLDRERLVNTPWLDPVPRSHTGRIAIPHLLQFRLIINRGAVFGVGENQRTFFIAFTACALLGAALVFATMTRRHDRIAHIGAGLIIAGGIGNLYDRVTFGVVRDFLHMFPGRELPFGWTWPGGNPDMFPWVFNIADMLLLIGMLMLTPRLQRKRRGVEEPEELLQTVDAG